jgi:alcohol dehydrogenase (cytochrome c)
LAAAALPGASPAAASILENMTLPGQGEDEDATYHAALAARSDLLNRLRSVDDARLVAPAAQDWLGWRGASDTQGFSKLNQIDRANVAGLALRWSLSMDSGTNGVAPIVQDGVMFVQSGISVRALNAATGDLLWKFSRPVSGAFISDQPHGIAVYGNAVYVPTIDGHVLALDAKSGKLLWDQEIAPAGHKFWLTAAPLAVHGKIIQGVSGCSSTGAAGGCFIVAYDAKTGQEAWRFHTIPRPGEPGDDSWNGAPWAKRFGASVWNAGSYDPDLNLVYFGTGQTYNISTLLDPQKRKGDSPDALYTDTTLAINPDTGKLVWFYQHAAEDVWDMDWSFERTLVTLDGQKVVITGGKLGIFDALDAKTGRYLWSFNFGLQNLVTKIDPKTGHKTYDPALMPEVDKHKFICPSIIGDRNWQTSAFDPAKGLLYVPITPTCMEFWRNDDAKALTLQHPGQMAIKMRRPKGSDGQFGWLAALDVVHQKVVWTDKWRAPQSSAALATAGGLVFNGTRDRVFRALDSSTGETVWETSLPALPNAYPFTYMVDGKQYVAIVTGGGTAFDSYVRLLTPEDSSGSNNKTIMVFALPDGSK